jgi:type VII secretion system ESX-1 transmembrane protein EccB
VPSRSELLRAHRFRLRRLIAAVCAGRLDDPPARLGLALLAGLIGSALLIAAVAVHARLSRPADWKRSDVVIMERETGREFVFRDGRLHAVPNIVSARLAIGAAAPVVVARHDDLRSVPAGGAWGIDGAPAAVPGPSGLAVSWTVCSSDGAPRLMFGGSVGGRRLGTHGVVVAVAGGVRQAITRDVVRAPMPGPAVTVAAEFVAAVPADASAPPPRTLVSAPGPVCAMHDGDGTTVVVNATPPAVRVTVAPGAGALVSSESDPESIYFVGDDGRRYPVAGATALACLGWSGLSPLVLPVAVLAMLPEGPRLSTTDARRLRQ